MKWGEGVALKKQTDAQTMSFQKLTNKNAKEYNQPSVIERIVTDLWTKTKLCK